VIIVVPAKPAAQAAKTHVPLMPQNVVHLGALFHVEMDAAILVNVPYTCSNDTFLKTVFRFSVQS
jgi:hypothetical protein